MAVVSRIATLRFDGTVGAFREWQSTTVTQDTPQGGSIVVTTVQTSGGLAPGEADTLTLNFYNDAGALIRAVSLSTSSNSQNTTYHFTDTGNSGGSNRHGTVLIDIRATKTTGGPTATYDYETDGSPSTPPSTFTATVDRGYLRGGTTITPSLSNISAGGAKSSPASYPDPLHVRLTTGSTAYSAVTYVAGLKEGATTKRTASTNSTTQTWDVAFTGTSLTLGRVNDGLTAASHTLTTFSTIPNSSLTGIAYTYLISAQVEDTITTDPRRFRTPLFQLDDNTFGTPPMSKDVPDHKRATTQQGFLASRTMNARNEGQNGVTYTVTLTPVKPGTPVSQSGLVTTTQGGETGWAPSLLAWSSSLPGGTWNKTFSVTAPSDATSVSHTVQSAGTNTVYTLVALDPDLKVRAYLNKKDDNPRMHFTAGDGILANFFVERLSTGKRVPANEILMPKVAIRHRNPKTEKIFFLKSDTATTFAGAWEEWNDVNEACTYFNMAETAIGSPGFMVKLFSATDAWDRDISGAFSCEIDGVVYSEVAVREEVGPYFAHDDSTGVASMPPGTFGGGGVTRLISLGEIEKAKKKKTLEALLDEDFTKEEFNDLLSSLVEKFKSSEPGARMLNDDEEALLHILMAINETGL